MPNPPGRPHFHPILSAGGFGAVEHEHHPGLLDQVHVHDGAPDLGPSQPRLPMPPGVDRRRLNRARRDRRRPH